ncbi:Nicotinate phosphoribosyltransferase 2 [Castilleja foliolosa]|uniref:nicotinate phosphoribosyltransferase n=1 Tax=Castilleja foliolosa TaxID=1961234 RepID=A0ABD3DXN1_9LAMI
MVKIPLMRIEGPVAAVQLLETPFVNLISFASLVATNAARHRFVAGKSKMLLEFGLRRAQGPDGGIGASKYCYMGGFDATSNVAARKLFGIPLRGTHSHAFVSSYTGPDEITEKSLKSSDGLNDCEDFVSLVQTWLSKIKVFDLYFRTNPFGGEYTIFAGLEECIRLIANFRFTDDEIAFIKSSLPSSCEVLDSDPY